ncbi:WCX domain-containing protein [Streptomyces flaveolus]
MPGSPRPVADLVIAPFYRARTPGASRDATCAARRPHPHLLSPTSQDLRHAVWALWRLSTDAEALAPASLRTVLLDRAAAMAARYEAAHAVSVVPSRRNAGSPNRRTSGSAAARQDRPG